MKQFRLPLRGVIVTAVALAALAVSASAVLTVSAASSTITTSPANITPQPLAGSDFTITVTENTAATTTGAQTDLLFNRTYFQINPGMVVYGAGYTAANWVQAAGVGGQTLAQAITEANTTGRLRNVAAYVNGPPGTATLAAGPQTFFTVQFHTQPGYVNQSVTFLPDNAEVLDAAGSANSVTTTGTTTGSVGGFASLSSASFGARSGSGMAIGLWLMLASVVGAGMFAAYRRMSPGKAQA